MSSRDHLLCLVVATVAVVVAIATILGDLKPARSKKADPPAVTSSAATTPARGASGPR